MVAEREPFEVKKYIIVGLLTFLIFSLGIMIGLVVEQLRDNELKYQNQVQDIAYNSLQLQSLFLFSLENTEDNCAVLITTLTQSVKNLGISLGKLLEWEKDATISKQELSLLKRKYMLDNIRYWLFATKNKQVCNADFIPILYFFSDEKCSICPNQGVILSYYKEIFQDRILIFPINTDLSSEEPMIQLLMSKFNVTDPTIPILIVEKERYEGVQSTESLKENICKAFSSEQQECVPFVS